MAQTNPAYFGYYNAASTLVDMTAYADIQNINLNRADVFQTWTDGNWNERRVKVRTKISGSVQLGFASESTYRSFLTALAAAAAASTDGTVKLKAYVNNVENVCEFFAYVDTVGAGKWDLLNSRQWQTLALNISER